LDCPTELTEQQTAKSATALSYYTLGFIAN